MFFDAIEVIGRSREDMGTYNAAINQGRHGDLIM